MLRSQTEIPIKTSINGQPSAHTQVPLVIGVTGHRNLRPADQPKLEKVVRSVFDNIRQKSPHTPLLVLSSLAEGADRLVARVALELKINLIVPLPMQRELYERDFSTPASRADFAKLLSQASYAFVLPVVKDCRNDAIGKDGAARDYQYEQTGAYIAKNSQILIALWDGECTDLVGGTSEVVKFQIEGVPASYVPRRNQLDGLEIGEVYHIITPTMTNPQPNGEAFSFRSLSHNSDRCDDPLILSDPKAEKSNCEGPSAFRGFERIYKHIDRFNEDLGKVLPGLSQELEKSKCKLFPDSKAERLPDPLKAMREQFAVADTLSNHFQKQARNTLDILFVCAFIAAAFFDVFAEMKFGHRFEVSTLGPYVLITIAAYYLLYRRAIRKDLQNKYQDYRALAEGMRVQFFWRLANLNLSVADHYLRKQRSELDWICSAVRAWNPTNWDKDRKFVSQGNEMQNIELVYEYWLTEQLKYFIISAHTDHRKLKRSEATVKYLFWGGVITAGTFALALLLFLLWHPEWLRDFFDFLEHHRNIHGSLVLLMSLPLILAALLHNFAEKNAWSEHAKQYNRMVQLFGRAAKLLREMIKNKEYRDARDLIENLGKEALSENGDWVFLHRERPLEVPHA